jgi:hypothetical protein
MFTPKISGEATVRVLCLILLHERIDHRHVLVLGSAFGNLKGLSEGLVLVDRQLVEEACNLNLQGHVHPALKVEPQAQRILIELLKPLAVVLLVVDPLGLSHTVHFVVDVQVLDRGKEIKPAQAHEENRKSNLKTVPLHGMYSFDGRSSAKVVEESPGVAVVA